MNTTYHLSHNDTDGFGSQYIVSKLFENIKYFNSGYGEKIDENLKKILKKIKKKDMLLITDLNLTMKQAIFLDDKRKEKGFKLLLIDHHGTGEKVAKRFDWYNLDTSKCATQLTYEYFFEPNVDTLLLKYTADIINAYDLYQEDNKFFNSGKSLNGVVMNHRKLFPEVFSSENREVMFHLIEKVSSSLYHTEGEVVISESIVPTVLRDFLSKKIINANSLPFDALKAEYLSSKIKEGIHFEKFNIQGKTIEVFFDTIDIFQELSQIRFKDYNVDIAIHIGKKGQISLRSNSDKNRVDIWATEIFNGGGHPQASGGIMHKNGLDQLSYVDAMDLFYENIKHI